MKWKARKELSVGDTRIKTRFLIFPKSINGEVRWFEKATYKQENITLYNKGDKWTDWSNIEWIKPCNHDWVLTDSNPLGMNPPEQIDEYTCSKCGKRKTGNSYF